MGHSRLMVSTPFWSRSALISAWLMHSRRNMRKACLVVRDRISGRPRWGGLSERWCAAGISAILGRLHSGSEIGLVVLRRRAESKAMEHPMVVVPALKVLRALAALGELLGRMVRVPSATSLVALVICLVQMTSVGCVRERCDEFRCRDIDQMDPPRLVGAPVPLACAHDADCVWADVPSADGCCPLGRHSAQGVEYRRFVDALRHGSECVAVECPAVEVVNDIPPWSPRCESGRCR